MSTKKIVTVIGATGAQGGGLARAILDDPGGPFLARAVTRDAQSERAAELSRLGADLVQADLDDAASLADAFRGAEAAFCVTNYWEYLSPERELVQATNLARAVHAAGVKHVIWSTFEDTRDWVPLDDDRMPTLMGRYKVPHFDAKAEANRQFTDRGVPVTFLLTSFYWDNLVHLGMGPKRGEDGVLAITLPMADRKLPGIAAADIGKCAYGILQRGSAYLGKTVGIAGGHPTGAEMAAALTVALGETVRYDDVPPEVYRGFGFPGADDLGNMFQFKRDFNDDYCRARSLEESRALNPGLQTFEDWVSRNRTRIPVD